MSQQIFLGLGAAAKNFIEATYSGHHNTYDSGDYRIVVWTSPGSFTVQNVGDGGSTPGAPYMDVALVGGGGTGAERHGPGCPSGGMGSATAYTAAVNSYSITVGGDRPGNTNSTNYSPGNGSNAFGYNAVGGGNRQLDQGNPGNSGGFNQYGPGNPAPGGDQGGGGAGTGGSGNPGGGNVGYGGEGRMIPFSPGHYGSPGGYFAAGGAGGGRGGSNAPTQNVGGGGGNPNGHATGQGSSGGGGRDHRSQTGTGKGGICIVKYKYQ